VALTLRGPRLVLRPWRLEDIEEATRWANDHDSLRVEERPLDQPVTTAEMEQIWRTVSSRGYAFIGWWRGKRVGEFILTFNGPLPLTGRIDLNVAPEFRRRGLGREGLALCADFAFRVLGMTAVYGYVGKENLASIGLHLSLGYRRDNRLEERPFVLKNTPSTRQRLAAVLGRRGRLVRDVKKPPQGRRLL
jgi:RimJ/RimL family protein N-acetyltransferase